MKEHQESAREAGLENRRRIASNLMHSASSHWSEMDQHWIRRPSEALLISAFVRMQLLLGLSGPGTSQQKFFVPVASA